MPNEIRDPSSVPETNKVWMLGTNTKTRELLLALYAGNLVEAVRRLNDYSYSIMFDLNRASVLLGIFVLISKLKSSDENADELKIYAKHVLNRVERLTNPIQIEQEGGNIKVLEVGTLPDMLIAGDGKAIYHLLNGVTFRKLLKLLGMEDKKANDLINTMKKITPWVREKSIDIINNKLVPIISKMTRTDYEAQRKVLEKNKKETPYEKIIKSRSQKHGSEAEGSSTTGKVDIKPAVEPVKPKTKSVPPSQPEPKHVPESADKVEITPAPKPVSQPVPPPQPQLASQPAPQPAPEKTLQTEPASQSAPQPVPESASKTESIPEPNPEPSKSEPKPESKSELESKSTPEPNSAVSIESNIELIKKCHLERKNLWDVERPPLAVDDETFKQIIHKYEGTVVYRSIAGKTPEEFETRYKNLMKYGCKSSTMLGENGERASGEGVYWGPVHSHVVERYGFLYLTDSIEEKGTTEGTYRVLYMAYLLEASHITPAESLATFYRSFVTPKATPRTLCATDYFVMRDNISFVLRKNFLDLSPYNSLDDVVKRLGVKHFAHYIFEEKTDKKGIERLDAWKRYKSCPGDWWTAVGLNKP